MDASNGHANQQHREMDRVQSTSCQ